MTELETASTLLMPVASLKSRIAPLQAALLEHPLYKSIHTAQHLRLFLQSHVFAVWDFMSLLKALQARLTCVSVPWTPSPWPASRRFLNEIVLGEESDLYEGRAVSHFELYLEAMDDFGANTEPMRALIDHPTANGALSLHAFRTPDDAPAEARDFVDTTFNVIRSGSVPALAAAFTFGREDVIPGIFHALVRELDAHSGRLTKLIWYLERHIEVDADDHGPLALRMMEDLCGTDERLWEEAAQAAETAITARLALWDGILERIRSGQAEAH